MNEERVCPVDGKPLFYAPNAPDDTAKMACSNPECINAHGMPPLDEWQVTSYHGEWSPLHSLDPKYARLFVNPGVVMPGTGKTIWKDGAPVGEPIMDEAAHYAETGKLFPIGEAHHYGILTEDEFEDQFPYAQQFINNLKEAMDNATPRPSVLELPDGQFITGPYELLEQVKLLTFKKEGPHELRYPVVFVEKDGSSKLVMGTEDQRGKTIYASKDEWDLNLKSQPVKAFKYDGDNKTAALRWARRIETSSVIEAGQHNLLITDDAKVAVVNPGDWMYVSPISGDIETVKVGEAFSKLFTGSVK